MAEENISPTDETTLNDSTTASDASSSGPTTGVSTPPNDPIESTPSTSSTPASTATPDHNGDTGLTSATVQGTPRTPPPQFTQFPQKPIQSDYSSHPAVQRADLLRTIAQTLAGGPRFQTTIDPNTGEMKHTPVPLSKADIGMAIAAEAIQGSLAGLAVANGPGSVGRAAAAGGAATMQTRQRVDQQQSDEANANFARHAQIFETNMRMHQNALAVGRLSLESNEKYVALFKPTIDDLEQNHPEVIKGVVDEADLPKYHVTKDAAIPYSVVPRLNPTTGQQVTNSYGEPQWDIKYAIIDPEFKSSLKPEIVEEAKNLHLPGFVDRDGKDIDLPQDVPMRLRMEAGITSKIGGFHVAKDSIDNYYKTINDHGSGASRSVWSMFPTTEAMADFIEGHEGSKPTDRSIRNKNAGNLAADASWHGKVDTSNLPANRHGVGYRIYDSKEEGKQALINQLNLDKSRMPNASPEQFFTKYAPDDVTAYSAAARQAAGVQTPQPTGNSYKPVDLLKEQQDDPQLINTLNKFNPILEAAKGNYETAIGALGKTDPQGAGKLLRILGGSDAIRAYDEKKANDLKASQAAEKLQETVAQDQALIPIRANQAAATATAVAEAKAKADNAENKELQEQYKDEVPANGVRTGYLAALQPGVRETVKSIGEGREDPNTLFRGKEGKALSDQVHFAYPQYDRARYPTYLKAREDLTSGPGSKDLNSFNTAIHHINVMLANSYGPGAYPLIGGVARGVGDQAAVNYADARAALVDEIGKAYKGSALTEEDKKTWSDRIKTWSPAEARANAPALLLLLDGKLNGIENNWRNAAPPGLVSPINIMSPEARQVFQAVMHRDPMTQVDTDDGKVIGGKQAEQQQKQNTVPDGKFAYKVNGQTVGYADDPSGKNYKSF